VVHELGLSGWIGTTALPTKNKVWLVDPPRGMSQGSITLACIFTPATLTEQQTTIRNARHTQRHNGVERPRDVAYEIYAMAGPGTLPAEDEDRRVGATATMLRTITVD